MLFNTQTVAFQNFKGACSVWILFNATDSTVEFDLPRLEVDDRRCSWHPPTMTTRWNLRAPLLPSALDTHRPRHRLRRCRLIVSRRGHPYDVVGSTSSKHPSQMTSAAGRVRSAVVRPVLCRRPRVVSPRPADAAAGRTLLTRYGRQRSCSIAAAPQTAKTLTTRTATACVDRRNSRDTAACKRSTSADRRRRRPADSPMDRRSFHYRRRPEVRRLPSSIRGTDSCRPHCDTDVDAP